VAGQVKLAGQAIHEGTEADALDHSANPDAVPDRSARRCGRDHPVSTRFAPRVTAASRCIRPKL
jgi:hypothetical protein